MKERPGDLVYGLYSSTDANRPQSQVTIGGIARLLDGTAQIPAATWTHVAATYDGTTQRLFVNGTQVSTLAVAGAIQTSTSPLRIGGNTIWSEWFSGLIDEVRVYNRALSAAEIQSDMNASISAPDGQAPTAPGTLAATGGLGQVSLSWGAATDNIGVARYNVHRGTTAGFTPSAANRIAQPTGTSYVDSALTPGTYYYRVTAEDAAANVGPAVERGERHRDSRHDPADAADDAHRDPGAGSGLAGVERRDRRRRDRPLQRSPLDDGGLHARAGEPDRAADRHELRGLGAHGRHLLLPRHRRRPGRERKRAVAAGERRRPDRAAARARRRVGLRRRRRHDGGGQLRQRQRRRDQRPDLDDGREVRQRAHVRRRQRPRHRRRREQPRPHDRDDARGVGAADRARQRLADGGDEGADVGRLLRPLRERNRGDQGPHRRDLHGHIPGRPVRARSWPLNTWTHIAATYNGTTLAVYVNGFQAGQLVTSGSITVGTGALRIGGNTIWGEWFQGEIDEVRVYNRALAATEIQADMNRPVTNPDAVAPSAPGTLVRDGRRSAPRS